MPQGTHEQISIGFSVWLSSVLELWEAATQSPEPAWHFNLPSNCEQREINKPKLGKRVKSFLTRPLKAFFFVFFFFCFLLITYREKEKYAFLPSTSELLYTKATSQSKTESNTLNPSERDPQKKKKKKKRPKNWITHCSEAMRRWVLRAPSYSKNPLHSTSTPKQGKIWQ